MSISILRDATVKVNGVDLSDHVQKVTVVKKADENDVTAMGAISKATKLGISDDMIQVTFFQDREEGSVNATLSPLQGENAPFEVIVTPVSGAISKTNPGHKIEEAILPEYTPLDGTVGAAETTDCTFKPAGGSGMKEVTA